MLTGNAMATNNPYYGITQVVEWSHSGNILAIGGDGGLWLYDEDFTETVHFQSFGGHISSLSWSPDDRMFAVMLDFFFLTSDPNDNHTDVATLDSSTGQILTQVSEELFSTPVVWNPDGSSIAIGDDQGTVHIYHSITGEEILSFSEEVEDNPWQPNSATALCWSGNQNRLVTRHFLGLYIVDDETGESEGFFRIPSLFAGTGACNPEGTILVTTDSYYINLETGEYIPEWMANDSTYTFAISWSPDGNRFITNSENHVVEIWDAQTGERLATLEGGGIQFEAGYNQYHDSLAWSPDGTIFAEAGQDGIVRIWDAETYELITTLDFTE
jgi:WD40 repeat protein